MCEPRAQRREEAGDSGDEQSDAEYLDRDSSEANTILDGGVHRSFAKEQNRSQESCRRNEKGELVRLTTQDRKSQPPRYQDDSSGDHLHHDREEFGEDLLERRSALVLGERPGRDGEVEELKQHQPSSGQEGTYHDLDSCWRSILGLLETWIVAQLRARTRRSSIESVAIGGLVEAKDLKEVHGRGRIPGMSFKGSWGPDPAGGYMARQFGYVETSQGCFGVAIAAKPVDGSFASARAMLDDIAAQIQQHMVAGGVLVCS